MEEVKDRPAENLAPNHRPWLSLPSLQQPEYEDQSQLASVLDHLKSAPGYVTNDELSELKSLINQASQGTHFILQVGDCAEAYSDCTPELINEKLRVYNVYRDLISGIIHKPVILLGRIAGQFTKPRSEPFETVNGVQVASYKGDLVNSIDPANRKPDPQRMVEGYNHSGTVYSSIRNLGSKVFTSHEALHILFEDAFTRQQENGYLNVSSHLLWLGERTRKLGSGHVELLSVISNPIGIKVGPNASIPDLISILQKLNPANEAGKIILILRIGLNHLRSQLPTVVSSIKAQNLNVSWLVDPMHANTYKTSNGYKSRKLDTLVEEVITVADILKECGECLAGVHLEAAFKDVTECIGLGIEEANLPNKYETLCDPRLNVEQTQFLLRELGNKLIS